MAANPDYVLSLGDVRAWEAGHGAIPRGAFVAMRTDWSKRWPDMDKMQNIGPDKVAHYPGWSQEVLTYLYETRKITASGHETTDTDPGIATSRADREPTLVTEGRVSRLKEKVTTVKQDRLDRQPDAMKLRRQTVEHPFGTLKAMPGSSRRYSPICNNNPCFRAYPIAHMYSPTPTIMNTPLSASACRNMSARNVWSSSNARMPSNT